MHLRKHPAHGLLVPRGRPVIVFLTVCTKDRTPWLADTGVHLLLRDVWSGASDWMVGRYVVMPDHVHLFAAPGAAERPLDTWVRYWKSQFTKRHARSDHRWQTDHWDTRLRHDESYQSKWDYVVANPVRRGLAQTPDDWPFQGEIHQLVW